MTISAGPDEVLLWNAFRSRWSALAELLLSSGAGIDAPISHGRRMVHLACESRDVNVFQRLVDANASLDLVDDDGSLPLHVACRQNALRIVQTLTSGNPDKALVMMEARDEEQRTPLWYACAEGHASVVQALFDRAGDHVVNEPDAANETPLLAALRAPRITEQVFDVVRTLYHANSPLPTAEEFDAACSELPSNERDALKLCLEQWEIGVRAGSNDATRVPFETFHRGVDALQTYFQDMSSSDRVVNRHKICIVGQSEFGKTSLLRSLVTNRPDVTHFFIRTIGIDLLEWQFTRPPALATRSSVRMLQNTPGAGGGAQQRRVEIQHATVWDFAGQDVYKATHAVFFTKHTLFLLCIDLSLYSRKLEEAHSAPRSKRERIMNEFVKENVLCWLRLIFARQPDARVVLIGTKADLLDFKDRPINEVKMDLDVRLQQWKNAFKKEIDLEIDRVRSPSNSQTNLLTASKDVKTLEDLKTNLDEVVPKRWVISSSRSEGGLHRARREIEAIIAANDRGVLIPETFSKVVDQISAMRREAQKLPEGSREWLEALIVPVTDLTKSLCLSIENLEIDKCDEILHLLHELGDVLWFQQHDVGFLRDAVILAPKILIEYIRYVVNHEHLDDNIKGKNDEQQRYLLEIRSEGRVAPGFLRELRYWQNSDKDVTLSLKRLLQSFQLAYPHESDEMTMDSSIIVPVFWNLHATVKPQPLSKMDLPYSTHLCWEYEFLDDVPSTLFLHLAAESYAPGCLRQVRDGYIQVKQEDAFVSRISIPRDELGVPQRIVRLEVLAPSADDAWIKLRFYCCAMEKVLMGYPGVQVVRYVTEGSTRKRHQVSVALDKMARQAHLNGLFTEDLAEFSWLPADMDWFIHKSWENPTAFAQYRLLKGVAEQTSRIEETVRACQRMAMATDRERQFPALWTVERTRHMGEDVMRVRFHSDLTGVCHHEPLRIKVPDELWVKCSKLIKVGLSIMSNVVPNAVTLPVLKVVVNDSVTAMTRAVGEHLVTCADVHSLLHKYDFNEQTGDVRVNGGDEGMHPDEAVKLLEKLVTLAGEEARDISQLTNLERRYTKAGTIIWGHRDELDSCGDVIQPKDALPPATSRGESGSSPSTTVDEKRRLVIKVTSASGPVVAQWTPKYLCDWQVVSGGRSLVCKTLAPPVNEKGRADWTSVTVNLGEFSVQRLVQDYAIELTVKRNRFLLGSKIVTQCRLPLSQVLSGDLDPESVVDFKLSNSDIQLSGHLKLSTQRPAGSECEGLERAGRVERSIDRSRDLRAIPDAMADTGIEDSAVNDFLLILEEHRKNCERQGKYVEADTAKNRLEELKVHEENRRREAMRSRQIAERLGVEEAHMLEFQQFNKVWDRKMEEYEQNVDELAGSLRERHKTELLEFQKRLLEKQPKPKFSKDLLNLRRIEEHLARQKDYNEAHKIKLKADALEAWELEKWKSCKQQEMLQREVKFKQRQKQDLDALQKRIQSGREEQKKQRQVDLERLLQRYQNVKAELQQQHNLERIRPLTYDPDKYEMSVMLVAD
ncbi:hypothetical protein P43SY_008716 [Pythium insidiosum]|uniref:Roc domain-containing protein n=1 Tax=Pythium insidiosum TaxID=114742 RepID=A0AAD5QAG8_PYTIN|nr:hypothetical protein P43SY_008716 [Pythium insidiosum]